MARNADVSALFAALIASKAQQRNEILARTQASDNLSFGGPGVNTGPSAKDIAYAAMRASGDTAVLRKPVPVQAARQSFMDQFKEGGSQILSGGQWLLDKLERPSAASAGVAASLYGQTKSNVAKAWWEGLTEKKYGHFADVIKQEDIDNGVYKKDQNAAYGVSGLIADVVTDPTTYIGPGLVSAGGRAVGKGLGALGLQLPKIVKNVGKLETVSAAERAAADLQHTGQTSVGPKAADELASLLEKQKAAQATKLAEPEVSPVATPQPTTDIPRPAATPAGKAPKSVAQLEAMLKLKAIQEHVGKIQPYKYSRTSAVRRIAEGDTSIPLPYHSAPDPVELARYNRQLGAFKSNVTRRERAQAAYEVADALKNKKTLPALPREEARTIAKRLAVSGKAVEKNNEIIRAMKGAGKTDLEIADHLDQIAKSEGDSLRIPVFVRKTGGIDPRTGKRIEIKGRWGVGGSIGVDEMENLLHTQKLAKPVPLTAKGKLETVKEAISDTGIVETKVRGRLTYGYGKGGKPRFEATKHSALLADSENLGEDLARMHVIDPDTDKLISLGSFLAKQNIDVKTLQTGNAAKVVDELTKTSGARRANPLFGGTPKAPNWKDLSEPVRPSDVHTPYTKEEVQSWIKEHASDLPPQTVAWLLNGKGKNVVRGPEGVVARARQLMNQMGNAGAFSKLDDALAAVEKGDVHPTQLQGLMDELGVSKVEEIRPAVAELTGRMTAKEEILHKATAQIDAAQEAIDTATASARPVEELMNTIQHSDEIAAADAKLTEGLNGYEKAAVDDIVRDVIQYQHYRPKNKSQFPYTTKRGVPRTDKTPGKGQAAHTNTFNEGAQLRAATATFSKVGDNWKKLAAEAKQAGQEVPNRAQYMYEHALPTLKAVEARLRQQNIPVVLGSKASGVPMGLSDILDVLPPDFVQKYVFTFTKALDPTQIMRIGELIVNFGSKKIDAETAAHGVLEHLVSPRHSTGLAYKAKQGQISWSNFSKFVNSQEGRDGIAQDVAEVFLKATPRIVDVANMRAYELNLKLGQHAKKVSDAVIQRATEVLADPWASTSQKTLAIADAGKSVASTSKNVVRQEGVERAPDGAEEVAKNLVENQVKSLDGANIAEQVVDDARKMNKVYETTDGVKFNHDLKVAGSDGMKGVHDFVEGIANSEGQHLVYDLGAKIEMGLQYRLARYMFGHVGNKTMRSELLNRTNLASTVSKHIGVQLSHMAKTYPKADINEAFLALQEGRVLDSDVFKDLNKVFGDIFGPVPDSNGNYVNLFTTLGVTAEDIAFHGKKFGILDTVYFPGGSSPEQMANHFRKWDIGERDVLEELNRLHAAAQNAGVVRTLGADISAWWGKKVAPVGERYVKLKDTGGKSIIHKMIDTDLYYPEEIAQELHVLEESLQTLHDPLAAGKLGRFYDGTMHALKAGWTIYRPGHHTRNAVGDGFFNYMDGVKVQHHIKALNVLHVGRGQYKDWDSLQALASVGLTPDDARIVVRNKRAGLELTASQAHKLMYQTGNLPDYRILEDIAFGEEGQKARDLATLLREKSPFKGRIHDAASTVSEVRDHYFRAAHWLHAFEQVKPKAGLKGEEQLRWMASQASSRVRKWHPDGSDLTMFEKKRMRRLIPFYSWMRKAIPLVVQSTYFRPGKVLIYPKAMYNVAASMGIDLDSYSDPFPQDQLFPSWLADATQGPVYKAMNNHYYGIRPGIPTADIMEDYFNSPKHTLQTVGGSMTPALKLPAELMFGKDVRTGLDIRDKTDYIDRQIPGISNIASLSGRSPSSGFTQLTQAAQTEQDYNPNASSGSLEALLNLMSGVGVMDMSKPNYIKSAQLEEKYKARDLYRKMQQGG